MQGFVEHILDPFYDENSRVLILGTIPSPKSREEGFFYAHPQNRFWRIMADLFCLPPFETKEEKCIFLKKHHIALWDVLHSCTITGADDQSIKNIVPNDLSVIFKKANLRAVFTTGKKAGALYQKYCYPHTKKEAVCLPSTSPANCRYYTYEKLLKEYKIILEYLK